MRTQGFSLRTRNFLLTFAQLALVAYMFQVAAVDHWRVDASHVVGVEGTSQHVAHCHGVSTCAEHGGSGTTAPAPVTLIPLAPPAVIERAALAEPSPTDTFVVTPHLPPRAA
jgi:hypothetical protein